MKSMFNDPDYSALLARVEAFQPDAPRQWGVMDAAQMMAHCSRSLELSLGRVTAPSVSNIFLRWVIKPWALGSLPIKKSSPTSDSLRVTEPKDFALEKQHLLENVRAAKDRGPVGDWPPHVAFGPLTAEEWGRLHHKHLDHHLRQFSA